MPGSITYGVASNVLGERGETIGFYGVTPVARPSGSAQGVTGVVSIATLSGSIWGFSCSATYYATINLIEAMRTALVNNGLITGS